MKKKLVKKSVKQKRRKKKMNASINELVINGETYIKKGEGSLVPALMKDGMKLQMIRSYGAGVFFGYVESKKAEANGVNIVIRNARRVYYWSGAASLSELSTLGTSKPTDCKITAPVDTQEIMNVIEIIDVSEKARASLESVKVWTAHK